VRREIKIVRMVHSIKERRFRGDMIQVFKIINGFDIAALNTCFHQSFSGLRGHTLKLYKCSFRTNIGTCYFSNRMAS